MDAEFKNQIRASPTDLSIRSQYANWLENEGRLEEATFHRMVAKGLICDHIWESGNPYVLGKEFDLPVRESVFRPVLVPGAWIEICRICRMIRFQGPFQMLK